MNKKRQIQELVVIFIIAAIITQNLPYEIIIKYSCFWICISILIDVRIVRFHASRKKLNEKEKEEIKKNGLIHFTSPENAENIIKCGYLKGKKSELGKYEKLQGPLVWTFYSKNIDNCRKWLNEKSAGINNPERFSVCLILTDFADKDIAMMYKQSTFQNGIIIYKGAVLKCTIKKYKNK